MNNIIAKNLYQGIITDTNCFTSQSLTPRTHQVVSELLKYHFDADAIKKYYFHNQSTAKTKLLTKALLSLNFHNDGLFTTMKIDHPTFIEAGATFEDTLGIIDSGMNISKTKASAILIEKKPNYIHCSLRGKGLINMGEIAKIFNGGGSSNIAAFQHEGDIKTLEIALVTEISKRLETYMNHNQSNADDTNEDELLF